jgi:hypothetical protein
VSRDFPTQNTEKIDIEHPNDPWSHAGSDAKQSTQVFLNKKASPASEARK